MFVLKAQGIAHTETNSRVLSNKKGTNKYIKIEEHSRDGSNKRTKTRAVVMVGNSRRHPYVDFMKSSGDD